MYNVLFTLFIAHLPILIYRCIYYSIFYINFNHCVFLCLLHSINDQLNPYIRKLHTVTNGMALSFFSPNKPSSNLSVIKRKVKYLIVSFILALFFYHPSNPTPLHYRCFDSYKRYIFQKY